MEELEQTLRAAGQVLHAARGQERESRHTARLLAVEAADAGLSQHRIAELLGVDRMTVRKWVGKR